MTIGLTIARGGSKRLPGKNLRPFCGHPLVAWTIMQMKTADHIGEVYLSTDSDEIEEVGWRYGAVVIRRPDWKDANEVAANRPFRHALSHLIREGKITIDDEVVMTLPTSPCVKPGDIDALIEEYRSYRPEAAAMYVKLREAVAYRILLPTTVRLDLFDKAYRYATLGPSVSITTPAWYLRSTGQISEFDSDLDKISSDLAIPREAHVGFWAEPWQSLEVDTEREFEFAEVAMNHFILKGIGMQVYHDYQTRRKHEDRVQKESST